MAVLSNAKEGVSADSRKEVEREELYGRHGSLGNHLLCSEECSPPLATDTIELAMPLVGALLPAVRRCSNHADPAICDHGRRARAQPAQRTPRYHLMEYVFC